MEEVGGWVGGYWDTHVGGGGTSCEEESALSDDGIDCR